MSYVNPKIYFSDPTAFQKGFQGSFDQYIKLQREQIEKQKKNDEIANKELEKISTALFDSDAYKEAEKGVRDTLSLYFKDAQAQYMSAKSPADKAKIMSDALSEAAQFVESYRTTNSSKGNIFAVDYSGKPIEGFFQSEGPAIPVYKDGKLGMTYGDKNNFISKEEMLQTKPLYVSEVEDGVEKKLNNALNDFNKQNIASDSFIGLNESKDRKIIDFVKDLSDKEKIAYQTRFGIELKEGESLEQVISEDLEDRFKNTKVYNESRVLYKKKLEQEKEVVGDAPISTIATTAMDNLKNASKGSRLQDFTGLSVSLGAQSGKVNGMKKIDDDNYELYVEIGTGKDKFTQPVKLSLSREDGRNAMKSLLSQYVSKNTSFTGKSREASMLELENQFDKFASPNLESTFISTSKQNIQLP